MPVIWRLLGYEQLPSGHYRVRALLSDGRFVQTTVTQDAWVNGHYYQALDHLAAIPPPPVGLR